MEPPRATSLHWVGSFTCVSCQHWLSPCLSPQPRQPSALSAPSHAQIHREHRRAPALPDPIRLFQLGLLAPVKTLVLTGPALGIFRTVGLDMSWPSAMRLYEWRCISNIVFKTNLNTDRRQHRAVSAAWFMWAYGHVTGTGQSDVL